MLTIIVIFFVSVHHKCVFACASVYLYIICLSVASSLCWSVLFCLVGIHDLPDPLINDDGHYHSEVIGTSTTEKDLPSGSISKQKKSIPFNVTQQHVKNVKLLIQCEECDMWRLVLSKSKLSPQSVDKLSNILDNISYTCGATFSDVLMPDDLSSVCIRVHKCYDPVEKLYYSCGFTDLICIYCSKTLPSADDLTTTEHYPQCSNCSSKPPLKRQTRKGKL